MPKNLLSRDRRWVVLFERDHDVAARLAADDASDVTAAGGVVRQHDVAGTKPFHRAVAGFDFDLTGQRDDVLAFRRWMEVIQMIGRRASKQNSRCRLQLGSFRITIELEIDVDLFKMRFVVRAGKNSHDLHEHGL